MWPARTIDGNLSVVVVTDTSRTSAATSSRTARKMAESLGFYLFSSLVAMAVLLAVACLHVMAWFDFGVDHNLVDHTMEANWEFFYLDIMETNWMFYGWLTVYAAQAVWLICTVISVYRESNLGPVVLERPVVNSYVFYLFILGLASTYGWIVLLDSRLYANYAVLCSMTSSVMLTVALGATLHATQHNGKELYRMGFKAEVVSLTLLVHNFIGLYTVWSVVNSMCGAAIVLFSQELMEKDNAQYLALGILLAYVIICSCADVLVARSISSHVILPYGLFFATFFQLAWYHESGSLYFILGVVFTCITGVIIVVKMVVGFTTCCQCTCSDTASTAPFVPEEEYGAVEYKDDSVCTDSYKSDTPSQLQAHQNKLLTAAIVHT